LGQLVIVPNRVATPNKNAKPRGGGLEVAVNTAFEQTRAAHPGFAVLSIGSKVGGRSPAPAQPSSVAHQSSKIRDVNLNSPAQGVTWGPFSVIAECVPADRPTRYGVKAQI